MGTMRKKTGRGEEHVFASVLRSLDAADDDARGAGERVWCPFHLQHRLYCIDDIAIYI